MKKKLLRLCSIVLVISMVLGNLVSLAADTESTETTETTGMSFSEYRKGVIDNPFASSVGTLEAEISLATDEELTAMGASNYNSIILGTYGKTGTSALPQLHFGIYSTSTTQALPWIRYHGASGETVQTVIFNYNLISNVGTGTKIHLSFVLDEVNEVTNITCYVNGNAVTDLASGYSQPSVSFKAPQVAYCVGGDYATDQSVRYFKGEIYSVATYADVRTADEITTDKDGIDDTTDENLMAYYDLTSVTDATTKVANGSAADTTQQYALNIVETWMTERKPALSDWDKENGDFSIAIVGDTQIATDYDVLNGYTEGNGVVSGIYDWIIENKDEKNIQFVMGLGDIVQDSPYAYYDGDDEDSTPDVKEDSIIDSEWDYAMNQIQKLDDAEIPYSLIRGNHDQQAKYINNVAYDYYKDSIDGSLDDTMLNTWQELIVNDIKYLILCLDLGASDKELAWAEEVIKTHPNHNVIITTHAYMDSDGTTLDQDGTTTNDLKYYPSQYPSALYPDETHSRNDGGEMWDECFSKYDNVVMIVSGHIGVDDVEMTPATGVNGNTVAQLLVDPQDLDVKLAKTTTDDRNKPTGMVCILNFSADGKTVQVEQISTAYTYTDETTGDVKNEYYMNTSQFTFEMNVIEDANQKLLLNEELMAVRPSYESANAGTVYRAFGQHTQNCAVNANQIILTKDNTTVISYSAPSDGLLRITDMTVGFHNNASTGKEFEFAVTDENGKVLSNNGSVLTFNESNASVSGLSIETRELKKGECTYFVFHSNLGTSNIIDCIPKMEFSIDEGATWKQVNTTHSSYFVPWPNDITAYPSETDYSKVEQGMGGFYYYYSDTYVLTEHRAESATKLVINPWQMTESFTSGTSTWPLSSNSGGCRTSISEIIVSSGYTNVISYEATSDGIIWIENMYTFVRTQTTTTTAYSVEFAVVDKDGNVLTNDGELYTMNSADTWTDARDNAENLTVSKRKIQKGERLYFVFHGITGLSSVRCDANIQFCEMGSTEATCVSPAYSSSDRTRMTLRASDATNDTIKQGVGNFYYEYSNAYELVEKSEPEYLYIQAEDMSAQTDINASFPFYKSSACMTNYGQIIATAGYTNVISYEAPEDGMICIDEMLVWIANPTTGRQAEFAVIDEDGEIISNNGKIYTTDSCATAADAKTAAKNLIVTKREIKKGERIYFVFHSVDGTQNSLRCNAKILFCADGTNTWTQVNSNYKSADMTLYSKNNYVSSSENSTVKPTQGLSLGDGLGAFYYQYTAENTADADGVKIGTESEGFVTVYEALLAGQTYCDKYVVEVASDGTAASYIDLDMLNIKKQSKINEDDSTKIDVRYIASVDNLSYKSVGFVFSLTNTEPTIGGEACAQRSLTKVYKRMLEGEGSRKAVNIYADDGCSTTYAYAFEILKTPADTTVYARAYVELSDGTIVYGETRAVTTTATGTAE